MPSTCVVPIVKVENVRPHTNADKLDLIDVLGYQMCVPKGKYVNGQVAVYIPADTLLPVEWADKWGVRNYLKGTDKNRVGRVRLRGEPSFGLVVDIPEGQTWQVGDNVAEFFKIVKYEPPIRPGQEDMAPYDEKIDPFFEKYTDIENGRIFTEVFKDGEEVIATEKLHGSNARSSIVSGVEVSGSHSNRRKKPEGDLATSLYWFPWSIPQVATLLKEMSRSHKVIVIYGEIYGGSVQNLAYGIPKGKGLGFRAFDILVDGKYLDYDGFKAVCDNYKVETVPVIYRGPFSMIKMKEISDGKTTMPGADHVREGVVVKPVKERIDPKIGRVVLKYIGTEYSLGEHGDFKDV